MSKTIDMEDRDAWTDDDIIFLRDRGRLPADFRLPDHLRLGAPTAPGLDETPYLGDIGTIPDPVALSSETEEFGGTFVDEDDLDDMNKTQLQAEARARSLSDDGTKQDLIDRIRASED